MRLIIGFLALIGLMVVMVFLAAIGLFTYDEVKRKISGDDFSASLSPVEPEETAAAEQDESDEQ